MGLLENQRRKRHEQSVDWNELVSMMLLDHEIDIAADEGIAENAQAHRATQIRDAVLERIGKPKVVRAFIDSDYEMRTPDKDAVVAQALEVSGYNLARRELPADVLAASAVPPASVASFEEPQWEDAPMSPEPRTEARLEPEPLLAPPLGSRSEPPVDEPRDEEAYEIAERAVQSWFERFPEVAEQAHDSDGGATPRSALVDEAYEAAVSTRDFAAASDSALTIFEEQSTIAFTQAETGVNKEWVVGFMQIRCIATGYMLTRLDHDTTMREFSGLFRDFFAS